MARTLPNFCVVLCIFVLFFVLFVLCRSLYCLCVYMCTVLLPPAGYPIAVKYISYHKLVDRSCCSYKALILKVGMFCCSESDVVQAYWYGYSTATAPLALFLFILKLSIPCIFRVLIISLIHQQNAHTQ